MILIAIGANLPGPEGSAPIDTCRACVPYVCDIKGLRFVALSDWYRAAALPRGDQPDFCNGVIRLCGEIAPEDLLKQLQAIEGQFGRTRGAPNAARSLDLDIIDINGMIRAAPDPVLPHPRCHLRAFVLRPILDVAPAWRNPVCGSSVTTLLSDLPPQAIKPWD